VIMGTDVELQRRHRARGLLRRSSRLVRRIDQVPCNTVKLVPPVNLLEQVPAAPGGQSPILIDLARRNRPSSFFRSRSHIKIPP